MQDRVLVFALAALPPFVAAQDEPFDVVAALGRGKVATEHFAAKLAFDYTAALIRVPVKIGERDCRMLLDTGAPMTVTPELARELGLTALGRFVAGDSSGHSREIEFVALPELDFGGVRYTDLVAVVVDLRVMPILRERGVDGLVGTNLLRLGALAIDYKARTVEVTDDTARLQPKSGVSLPFTTSVQGAPYLTLGIGSKPVPGVQLDTGSNGSLQLLAASLGELPPERQVQVLGGSNSSGAFGKTRGGSTLVWLTDLSFGSEPLPGMLAEAQVDGGERIGNRFFERTRLVLDWRTSRLWIETPAQLGRAQLRTHGLAVKHENDAVLVSTVLAGSAAARHGLAADQRVLAVGEIDLRAGGLPEFVRAVELLRDEAATDVAVTIERDGKPVVVKLELECLLPR